jgi:hypothetical protein
VTFSISRPSQIYPNWDFWFENIPSGNPGQQQQKKDNFQLDLDLSGNRLTTLVPEALDGLTRLETLRLELNRLAAIPLQALAKLPGEQEPML